MKPEQQKQLKPGDEIFIRATYIRTDSLGDIVFTVNFRCGGIVDASSYSVPENVFLRSDLQQPAEKPKYDPCRRFKKRDIVRMVERMGRMECTAPVDEFFQTRPLTVIEDERLDTNLVKVESEDGRTKLFHWWYLELVTPVEELEPYSVGESSDYFSVDKDDDELCLYWKDKHPNAKKSAEAERDRLNAEYRKEADNETH